MADDNAQKKAKPLSFAKLTQLAYKLESEQAHTAFGKMPMSHERTEPQFQVGKATRDQQAKVFLGSLTVQENMGKGSPPPAYVYEDTIKYKSGPKWSQGFAERLPQVKPKFDHYENVLFFDDGPAADNNRRHRVCAPKIGTEPRLVTGMHENKTPGPQYLIKQRPDMHQSSLFTFGYRRGQAGLKCEVSTPGAVGPGRYVPESSRNPSTKLDFPRWTLPKAPRPEQAQRKFDKHQTYDMRSSFSVQPSSKNRSAQTAHFGSSTRQHVQKQGIFNDQFRQVQSVKIMMPRF